jgi:hypothetical protein
MLLLRWTLLAALPMWAQLPTCTAPVWSTCDVAFDLQPAENPAGVELHAEFRSPRQRTLVIQAFREGDRRYVLRFAPTAAGDWDYKLTSSLKRLDGQLGKVTGEASDAPGFVRVANVHHFQTANNKPHLWMATALDNFIKMPRADFDRTVEQQAAAKFTHLRVTIDDGADLVEAAERIRDINAHGLVCDLVLSGLPEERTARQRYITEVVARFGAMNITWAGVPAFERLAGGRTILKDTGALIAKLDPYNHPRTSMAESTSAPLIGDQWMTVLSYGTADPNIGAVEHQFYPAPALNTGIQSVSDLWNATMNGQYPASGSGGYMTVWYDFMAGNRYWELEPYFDVDGGRALALEGVEYIVYIEKPGPVELEVEDHGYDVTWIHPTTGDRVKAKGYKGKRFTGEPPDKAHDWILRVSREGEKESMLKSYKFESRVVPIQEIESNAAKVPFEITAPAEGDLSLARLPKYSLKTVRATRATRSLLVEWSAEVAVDGEGYRVVGVGTDGTLRIPASIAHKLPAVTSLHVSILNANGKAYVIDRVYRLVP